MNFNDLMKTSITRLKEKTQLRAFSPGSIARSILETYNDITAEIELSLDLKILNKMVSKAAGSNLDEIGLLVGESRVDSAYATGLLQISIDPVYGNTVADLIEIIFQRTGVFLDSIVIPAGTEVTTSNGGVAFNLASDVTLTDETVYVDIIAKAVGVYGNISSGMISKFSSLSQDLLYIKDFLVITNHEPISTGAPSESDDNYRYRIVNKFNASAMANETALRLSALSVPGVSNIIIKRYAFGIGTVGILVISESPIVSQGLLDIVQIACNLVSSEGDRVVVTAPEYKAFNFDIVLEFYENTSITVKDTNVRTVQNNIIAYVNNLQIGEEFIINQIGSIIFDTSNTIRDYTIRRIGLGDYISQTGLIENYKDIVPTNQPIGEMSKFVSNEFLCEICY